MSRFSQANGKIEKMLLLTLCGLGDSVCYLPTLEKIKERFEHAEITILSISSGREIFEQHNKQVSVIVFNRKSVLVDLFHGLKMLSQIRRKKYDVVISRGLTNSIRIPMLAFICGAKLRIGSSLEKLSFLYNIRINIPADTHSVCGNQMLLQGIGITTRPVKGYAKLKPKIENREAAYAAAKSAGVDLEKAIVGFAIGSDQTKRRKWVPALKCWSIENYAQVARWLNDNLSCTVIIFGSKGEEEDGQRLGHLGGPGVVSLCGKTSIGELQWIIQRCDLVVCGDSGIGHLAAALDVPVLALFGPTNPANWAPIGERRELLVGQAPCAPCYPKPRCGRTDCLAMNSICPDTVINKIRNMLDRYRKAEI